MSRFLYESALITPGCRVAVPFPFMAKHESSLPHWIQTLLVGAGRSLTTPITTVGLETAGDWAAALSRIYPRLQPSRFRRAEENLRIAFPEWDDARIHDVAQRCYEHLFRLAVEMLYVPRLINPDGYARHLHFGAIAPGLRRLLSNKPVILISGHCGNWELIGYAISMLGFPMHAVYRPFDLRPLDEWVREARARRGLMLVSKFGAVRALPPVLKAGQPVGLVADQSGGDRGIFVPFFGRLTSTYKSIGLLALQTNAQLVCGVARRLAPGEAPPPGGRWMPATNDDHPGKGSAGLSYGVELVDQFGPDDWNGRSDRLFYITARYRRAIESMIRKSPDQYFWMHRIWRSRPAHERLKKPFPPALREKMLALPWMTVEEVDKIQDQSERDSA